MTFRPVAFVDGDGAAYVARTMPEYMTALWNNWERIGTLPEVDSTPPDPSNPYQVPLIPGPPGPPGAAGTGGFMLHTQAAPAATWTIPHGLGREPHSIEVHVDGEVVETDTHADETNVVLIFASPTAGVAHIL